MQNYFQDLSFTNTTTQAPQTQSLYHLLRNQRKITQLTLDGDAKTFLNYTNTGELWVSLIRQQGLWIGRFGEEGWLQLVMQCENKLKSFWTKKNIPETIVEQGWDTNNIWAPNTDCFQPSQLIEKEYKYESTKNQFRSRLFYREDSVVNENCLWKTEKWDVYNQIIANSAANVYGVDGCAMEKVEYIYIGKSNYPTIYRYGDIASNISVKSNVDISGTLKLCIDNVHFAAIKHPLVEDLYIFPETVIGVLPVPLIYMQYTPVNLVGCEHRDICVDYIRLDLEGRNYMVLSPDIKKYFFAKNINY